jgi:hypothetical protein
LVSNKLDMLQFNFENILLFTVYDHPLYVVYPDCSMRYVKLLAGYRGSSSNHT